MAKTAAKTAPAKTDPAFELAELKKQIHALLTEAQAHVSFEDAIKDFPAELRSQRPHGLPYSAWQLLEHMRITLRDILDFSAPPTGGYQPLEWPKGYWPEEVEPPHANSWDQSIATIRSDLKKFQALIDKPGVDLFKPFRWGEGQNLLREALLIADHNAYHLGEFVVLRRLLGAWYK
jgi:hypothetical protein